MAPMTRNTLALAGAATAAVFVSQSFVLAPAGAAAPRAAGTIATPASSQQGVAAGWDSGSAAALVGLGAASIAMASSKRATAKRAQVVCMAAAEKKAPPAEKEAPPPPPPFNPAEQVGALPPLGFFDPLGFTKVGDEESFRVLRIAELKHARVAMMAALGAVVQPAIKFPGFGDVPAGLGAVTTAPGSYGFVVLFVIAGVLETAVWTEDPGKEPGNFGDPLGLGMYDEDMRNKELNNGRFAMFAALGLILAELATGETGLDQLS